MRPGAFEPAPYVGIPYASRGAARAGVDCWGLVRLVYREQLAVELGALDYVDAEGLADVARCAAVEAARGWRQVVERAPFDVVLFRMLGHAAHCGVLIDSFAFLHCLNGRHTCIERVDDLCWAPRLAGVYRLR